MRKIKFRAFDSIKGEMIQIQARGSISDLEDGNGWNVMQYTGLKDKNGTEIYEGDIVFLEPYLKHSPAKVSFEGGSFRLELDGLFSPMQLTQSDTLEVIGNIHESPELLEE